MEISPRTVILLFVNYVMFVIKNPDYQHSVFDTNLEFFKALYKDVVNLYRVDELPPQSFMSVGEMAV